MGSESTSWRIRSQRLDVKFTKSLRLGGCFLVSKIRSEISKMLSCVSQGRGEGTAAKRGFLSSSAGSHAYVESHGRGEFKGKREKEGLKCFGVSRWFVTIDRGWENRDKEEKNNAFYAIKRFLVVSSLSRKIPLDFIW